MHMYSSQKSVITIKNGKEFRAFEKPLVEAMLLLKLNWNWTELKTIDLKSSENSQPLSVTGKLDNVEKVLKPCDYQSETAWC